jgi:hypothetical protein
LRELDTERRIAVEQDAADKCVAHEAEVRPLQDFFATPGKVVLML